MINQITVLVFFTFLSLNVQAFQTQSFNSKKYTSLCMNAEGLPGQLPPMGYFDPFALAENKSDLQVKIRQIFHLDPNM